MFEQARDPASASRSRGLHAIAVEPATSHVVADARAGRFAGPRILVVGCGDVGVRLIARLGDRFRVHAVTHSPERAPALRRLGAVPVVADLDAPATLHRLQGLAPDVVHLAPPATRGDDDFRTRALLNALHAVRRFVYISTTGVYGDCGGAWVDETRTVAPSTDRARRRVAAERRLRAWARERHVALTILRVPGIYAGDRLPLSRLDGATPVLRDEDDVFTNHVHADDLARAIVLALHRGRPLRVYHAVDASAMKMGDWFDAIAATHGLPSPRRVSRGEMATLVGPDRLSFMSESRRLTSQRLRDELGLRLAYPTVREGLAAARGPAE